MYVFGDFVLDTQLYQLRRGDDVIPLEPKVFDVLRYLVEHNDRVATKRELLDALWPNEVVTEAVLPTNINALRRALGQKRGDKLPIETVHGRGYRFAMPVTKSVGARSSIRPSMRTSFAPMDDIELEDDHEPFVGQVGLISKLKRSLVRALGEQGQVCLLSGEAGIGKTRLARRIAELARAHGADVWMGACPEGAATPALWPWTQVLRGALNVEGAEQLRRWLGPSAQELAPWVPELSDEREVPVPSGRDNPSFRLFDAVVRVLSHAAKNRPRVVWLEDMHRADDASWQLLRLLTPHLERASVLVIVTVRSRDDLTVAAPVQRNVDSLLRAPFCHRYYVRGLEEQDTKELVEKMLGRPVEAELVHVLHEKTGGNPLFVRELVEWLDARGRTDVAALKEAPDLAPPEMVKHVLRRRVMRLGPEAQRVLEAGAVIGPTWDVWGVEKVTGLSREAVLAVVDAALAQRIIVPLTARVEGYRFAHDLLRDTLYSDLPTAHRKRMHLAVASGLEERAAWLGTAGVREVAHHLYHALPDGQPSVAIAWLTRAAELTAQDGGYDDAARYYRMAVDATRLLPAADPELVASLNDARARMTQAGKDARLATQS
jgi:predicted ATPase/DNA-binding winged helix-turn-helix (wHTH) protein